MRYLIILFIVSLHLSAQAQINHVVSIHTAKIFLTQPIGSMEQSFEVLPDYLGNPQLMTNLLLNLENSSQKILISRSFDGENWEVINQIDLAHLNRSSYQNLPIQVDLEDLEQLIQKTTHHIYLRTSILSKDMRYDFPQIAQLSKQELKKIRKTGQNRVLTLK